VLLVAVLWSPEFSVGVSAIDEQHQELFKRIDSLLEACNRGQGRQMVGEVIAFLEDYVKTHFATEEKQMIKYAYSEYLTHRTEHKQFIENFSQLKKKFEETGPGIQLVVLTNKIVVDWLKNHIMTTDTKLGTFLKEK
jgi:hemerythrin